MNKEDRLYCIDSALTNLGSVVLDCKNLIAMVKIGAPMDYPLRISFVMARLGLCKNLLDEAVFEFDHSHEGGD